MSKSQNYLMWNMTRQCNYRCAYCYYPHDPPPVRDALDSDSLLRFLEGTGRSWLVGMTGGEPLLYPDFVPLCSSLTQQHRISIDTNLSLPGVVRQFAQEIDPGRVEEFYVSLHIEERERLKGVDIFVRNARLLMDAGFNVIVNYVLHPDLVQRFARDRAFFQEHGISLRPRPFKGKHQGQHYPEAYSAEAREMLSIHPGAGTKMVYNFHGIPCEGGRSFIRMEPDGTVFRCSGEKTVLGNVQTGVQLYEQAEPCRVTRCPCRGVDHVHLTPAQKAFLRGLQLGLLGQSEEAREAYAQTLQLDPEHSAARNNTGVLLWQQNLHERALDCFAAARATQPDESVYAWNTALALLHQGRSRQAWQECQSYLARHQDTELQELYTCIERQGAPCEAAAPRLSMRVASCATSCIAA